jgi:hypothetical protein
VFTAQYGLIPYIKQITFRLEKVKELMKYFPSCGFGGLVISMLASGAQSSRVKTGPKPSDFSGAKKSSACLYSEEK